MLDTDGSSRFPTPAESIVIDPADTRGRLVRNVGTLQMKKKKRIANGLHCYVFVVVVSLLLCGLVASYHY